MKTFTKKETAMMVAFISEGVSNTSSETPEECIADNMTWMSATDLCGKLGWGKQEVGGVMSSLSQQGLIIDSDESARGATDTDWFASDEGIKEFWVDYRISKIEL